MALPKIDQPLFDLTIPSTKQKIKFRPFTVKEEKILLMAQEGKDDEGIINAIKQVINNCVQTDIDVEQLAIFDLEFLLINIRSKSVNNMVEFAIDDEGEEIKLTVNLDDISVIETEGHTSTLKIRDDVALVMRYPDIRSISKMMNGDVDTEAMFTIMMHCIDMIAVGEETYIMKDNTLEEQIEFVESLTSDTIDKIKQFFDTMPTVKCDIPYTKKDGTEKIFSLKGLDAFFI